MQFALATVTFANTTGIARDNVVNDFVAVTDPAKTPAVVGADLLAALTRFYNLASEPFDLAHYLGAQLSRVAAQTTVRAYTLDGHLDGTPHGSPFFTGTFTLDPRAGGNTFPDEVACVATIRAAGWDTALVEVPDGADPGTLVDRPRQRRSGRCYIGPLEAAAADFTTDAPRPSVAFMQVVRAAYQTLAADLVAGGHHLGVWSRVDAAVRNAVRVEVDNAFDTQRRRGVRATSRINSVLA